MAKQKGYINVDGTLGELTFYRKNGKNFIRTKGGIDKNRIFKDKAFKRTRENMKEFGASAKVGKSLRLGYASIIKRMSDSSIVGRVTGLMKRVNSAGGGLRGQRTFEILNNKVIFEGFEFNKFLPLDAVFYPTYASPVLDANRSMATWVIPDFNTSNLIDASEGATHFKLILATTVLSNFVFNTEQGLYEAVNAAENETHGITFSAHIPVGGMVGSDTNLSVDLGFDAALPDTVGVITAIGIVFYQQINTVFYELTSDNAMRIDVVG